MLEDLKPRVGSAAERAIRALRRSLWLVATLAFVEAVYVLFVSAGRLGDWPVYGDYYDRLAEAFRAGQLHLLTPPHPDLLRTADPYDTVNGRYWMIDLSLYDGKYYLYWGPVPGLLQALAKSVLGIQRIIGDQYLAFAFVSLSAISGALLVERAARRMFSGVPRWLVVIAILTLAFINPYLHLLTTGNVYIVAIAGGQAFLMLGLLFAFDAVYLPHSARRNLILAGVAWALALGCRINLAPAIAVLMLASVIVVARRSTSPWRTLFTGSIALGVPVVSAILGLLVYNKVRFDQWFEFGTNIQLGYFKFRFSPDYFAVNLYTYLARPFESSCHFPFVFQAWNMGKESLPSWIARPAGYLISEPVVGWLKGAPITWFIPFALVLAPYRWAPRTPQRAVYVWFLVGLAAIAALPGIPAMGLYIATMRYMGDVMNALGLLGIFGAFAICTHRMTRFSPHLTRWVVAAFGAATVILGMALGYQGYNGHFHHFNGEADRWFRTHLSTCGSPAPAVPRYSPWGNPGNL